MKNDQIKNKKATINPINKKGNKCFQYAVAVLLNHKEIGKHTERITKIKAFINKNKWEGIKFPSENDNWKKIEKNDVATPLLVLLKQKKIKYILLIFQGIT